MTSTHDGSASLVGRDDVVLLRNGSLAAIVAVEPVGPPTILWWGPDDGGLDASDLAAVLDVTGRPLAHNALDDLTPLSLVPSTGAGHTGACAIAGHGTAPVCGRPVAPGTAPVFGPARVLSSNTDHLVTETTSAGGLALCCELRLTASGVLAVQVRLRNDGEGPFELATLAAVVPLPGQATSGVTFTGRWCREFHPRRIDLSEPVTVVAESRRGRTSHDHLPLALAGTDGFGATSGQVWALHVAHSGNHRLVIERLADGRALLLGGELLEPGEIRLEPGAVYRSPWLYATASATGTNGISAAFHRFCRSELGWPSRPRPVGLNTWEAVYFAHDEAALRTLAGHAAAIGVERFVLDDGWFLGRIDDRRALGDWTPDPVRYPDGLRPLGDHVRSLGMELALWVEPEMVNPDSELHRAHPDWALTGEGGPQPQRNQLCLDLANPDVTEYLRERLAELVAENDIAALKWDCNRDLLGVGAHRQVAALYALLDDLRASHPTLEIESCASGGGRVDLEIGRRTCRYWASDCNDPIERLSIQRSIGLLLPYEAIGAHIGPERAHTTGRRHTLAMRAAVAFFGHLGLEFDLTALDEEERRQLAHVIGEYRRLRPLLHGGLAVQLDHPDAAGVAHGVVAEDRRWALFGYFQVDSSVAAVPPSLRFVGLDDDQHYVVRPLELAPQDLGPQRRPPAWMSRTPEDPLVVSGRVLRTIGLQLPICPPASALLVELHTELGAAELGAAELGAAELEART